MKNISMYYVA